MKRVAGRIGLAVAAVGVAVALSTGGTAVADDEVQASLVEDFTYPGKDATARLESGVEETYEVPANRLQEIDIDPLNARAPQSILLELRFGDW